MPPAETDAVVPSSFLSIVGASAGPFGASTMGFASGGGAPVGGAGASAEAWLARVIVAKARQPERTNRRTLARAARDEPCESWDALPVAGRVDYPVDRGDHPARRRRARGRDDETEPAHLVLGPESPSDALVGVLLEAAVELEALALLQQHRE